MCLNNLATNVTMRAFCETCGGTSGSNSSISNYYVSLSISVFLVTNVTNGLVGTSSLAACVNVVDPLSVKCQYGSDFIFLKIPGLGKFRIGIPTVEDVITSLGILRSCNKAVAFNYHGIYVASAVSLEGYSILVRRKLLEENVASRHRQYCHDHNDQQCE